MGLDECAGQRFGVAKIVKIPRTLSVVDVQWYDADSEFGEYRPSTTPNGTPWTQTLLSKHIITSSFLLQNGRIPHDTAKALQEMLTELESLALDESDSDTTKDIDED